MEQIVVCVGGVQADEAALDWAARRAFGHGSSLLVVTVEVPKPGAKSLGSTGVGRRSQAEAAASRLSFRWPSLDLQAMAIPGEPGPALRSLSRHAGLLVVGRDHFGAEAGVSRDTALVVAVGSSCPVVVVPGRTVPLVKRVVVGVGHGDVARSVLAGAARHAVLDGHDLCLVHGCHAHSCGVLESSIDVVSGLDRELAVVGVLERRSAVQALIRQGAHASMIVMGRTNALTVRRPAWRNIKGMMEASTCPVMVLPPDGLSTTDRVSR